MGENFENAGLEAGEVSDDRSTEDEVDSIVAQSPSVRAEDDIDDAGLLRGMLQVTIRILVRDKNGNGGYEFYTFYLQQSGIALIKRRRY